MKKNILIVDDERDIVDLISYNLQKEGYGVSSASNGEEALEKAGQGVDLIILDLMMPVLDGFETCKRLKSVPQTANIPIIFLTARSTEADEVIGLELGADDFIQKPISPRKLLARVKTVFRRLEAPVGELQGADLITIDRLEINKTNYTVRFEQREIFFPKKEFEILSLLASQRGKVFSREELLDRIWGKDVYVIDRTVDVHVRRIREKLGELAHWIETVKGVGYRFKA